MSNPSGCYCGPIRADPLDALSGEPPPYFDKVILFACGTFTDPSTWIDENTTPSIRKSIRDKKIKSGGRLFLPNPLIELQALSDRLIELESVTETAVELIKNPTVEKVRDTLTELKKTSTTETRVLIYISTHGCVDGIMFNNGMIHKTEVHELLGATNYKRMCVINDTCHSDSESLSTGCKIEPEQSGESFFSISTCLKTEVAWDGLFCPLFMFALTGGEGLTILPLTNIVSSTSIETGLGQLLTMVNQRPVFRSQTCGIFPFVKLKHKPELSEDGKTNLLSCLEEIIFGKFRRTGSMSDLMNDFISSHMTREEIIIFAKSINKVIRSGETFPTQVSRLTLIVKLFLTTFEKTINAGKLASAIISAVSLHIVCKKTAAKVMTNVIQTQVGKILAQTAAQTTAQTAAQTAAQAVPYSQLAASCSSGEPIIRGLTPVVKQASKTTSKTIAKTCVKAAAVAGAVEAGFVVGYLINDTRKYMNGDIEGKKIVENLGTNIKHGVISTAGAAVGQTLIPIPVVGAIVGSLVFTWFFT